jgi:protein gp37
MSWRIQNNSKRPDRYEGVVEERGGGERDTMLAYRRWTGRVNLDYGALEAPYRWRKPRTVFVQSMGDLFHEKVPGDFIHEVWDRMQSNQRHTFLVLTKRAERMKEFLKSAWGYPPVRNVWLGVTAENQEMADLRIPYLSQTPAAVRWVSVEPMLSGIDVRPYLGPVRQWEKLDWVVIGAESGPNARLMKGQWAKDLISQCDEAQVPVFVKQISKHKRLNKIGVSKDPSEWQVELQRREWPR